jgi:hypothetical protein
MHSPYTLEISNDVQAGQDVPLEVSIVDCRPTNFIEESNTPNTQNMARNGKTHHKRFPEYLIKEST